MKKCYRCEINLPNFFYAKTNVEHIKKMKCNKERGFTCRWCAWRLKNNIGDYLALLDENYKLKKEILKWKRIAETKG